MVDLLGTALRFVRLYGPLGLAAFTFLETSLLFPFLPSELVVPAAAAVIVTDPASVGTFALAGGVGGTAGAFVPFALFRRTWLDDRDPLRNYLHVSPDRVRQGQRWFHRWGQSSVCWGRFLPVLRSVVSIPAAMAGMHWARFGAYTAVGTVGYYAATGWVIHYTRRNSLLAAAADAAAARPTVAIAVAVSLSLVALLGWRWRRRSA